MITLVAVLRIYGTWARVDTRRPDEEAVEIIQGETVVGLGMAGVRGKCLLDVI